MYLRRVELKNIRSVRELVWEPKRESLAGWHVVLGDNGAGKSTFLRSIALGFIGPYEAGALRQNWNEWLTRGEERGFVDLEIEAHVGPDVGPGVKNAQAGKASLSAAIEFNRRSTVEIAPGSNKQTAEGLVWGKEGRWFSASYGPFRRFSGGDRQYERMFYSEPKLARHLSVFGEDVALTEALEWVKKLQFKALEKHPEGSLLARLIEFVNQPDFLPHGAKLHSITSDGVIFLDGNEREITVLEMSDGYRSILSMTFELIRQLSIAYGAEDVFDPSRPGVIKAPGVVMIDEVDVHLHPTWQKKVGMWFRKHFPNLQFIVSTHSPLICQAAEVGTVFKLPTPGTDETGEFVEGNELERLLYGNILDAYSTGVFGEGVTRSESGKERLKRLAELNVRALRENLSPGEQQERVELQASTPTAAQTTGVPGGRQ